VLEQDKSNEIQIIGKQGHLQEASWRVAYVKKRDFPAFEVSVTGNLEKYLSEADIGNSEPIESTAVNIPLSKITVQASSHTFYTNMIVPLGFVCGFLLILFTLTVWSNASKTLSKPLDMLLSIMLPMLGIGVFMLQYALLMQSLSNFQAVLLGLATALIAFTVLIFAGRSLNIIGETTFYKLFASIIKQIPLFKQIALFSGTDSDRKKKAAEACTGSDPKEKAAGASTDSDPKGKAAGAE
jgi:hypothetical protein